MIPKFRAWDKDAKVMYGWENLIMEKDDRTDNWMIGYRQSPNIVEYDHEQVIMQSTGLKDKKGVEIFEGDFCIQRGEEPYSDENMTLDEDWEYRGIIKFQDFAYWLQDNEGFLKWLGTDCDEIEIIGNRFENPELLEVEG